MSEARRMRGNLLCNGSRTGQRVEWLGVEKSSRGQEVFIYPCFDVDIDVE